MRVVLFVVLAADNVMRLHKHVPAGDVVARLIYMRHKRRGRLGLRPPK